MEMGRSGGAEFPGSVQPGRSPGAVGMTLEVFPGCFPWDVDVSQESFFFFFQPVQEFHSTKLLLFPSQTSHHSSLLPSSHEKTQSLHSFKRALKSTISCALPAETPGRESGGFRDGSSCHSRLRGLEFGMMRCSHSSKAGEGPRSLCPSWAAAREH